MIKTLATTTLVALALAAPVSATAGVNTRQARQAARIAAGVESGELTKKEAKKLRKQQANIRQTERKFRSDGRLTARERAILDAQLDQAAIAIAKQANDGQTR